MQACMIRQMYLALLAILLYILEFLVFFGTKMAFLEDHSICQRNEIPAQEEGVEQQISLG